MTVDLVKQLESAVLTQLHGAQGLCSLTIQNHIYGCYILMEDIALAHVELTGTAVHTKGQGQRPTQGQGPYSFDFDKGFGDIGLRYGFLMDTKLELNTYLPEYKAAWMRCFEEMGKTHDVSVSDAIEDTVTEAIQRTVPASHGFFMNAVEHGALSKEWVGVVLGLLRGGTIADTVETVESADAVEDRPLAHAQIEKPVAHGKPAAIPSNRRLGTTRRNKERHEGNAVQDVPSVTRKTRLAKTRKQRHNGDTKN
jgi:hypothetical protein